MKMSYPINKKARMIRELKLRRDETVAKIRKAQSDIAHWEEDLRMINEVLDKINKRGE